MSREEKIIGNLPVGQTHGNQPDNGGFAGREFHGIQVSIFYVTQVQQALDFLYYLFLLLPQVNGSVYPWA